MNSTEKESQNRKPLAYRMRKSVRYYERNKSTLLILSFPLKVIILHHFWSPLFECLSKGNSVTFENILSLVNQSDSEKIEIFLNDLARKGFLEKEGFPILANYQDVSIIIPVRNRPKEITACLDSLSQLDYPDEKIEIIVVDDASDDNTADAVSKFPVNLIALKEHKQASFCRNLAAQRAKGSILAFIDSDCLADTLWLKELIPAFKDPSLGAVGGMVDSYFNEKGLDRYEKVKSSLNMGSWFKSSREDSTFFYVPSCNLLVRRALFLRLGGFKDDLHVGEDVDLCWRLQDDGYHVEYRPVGRVYHKHRNIIRYFCARRFDYGTSEALLQRLHAKRIKHLIFPPAESLFWGLVVLSIIFEYIPLMVLSGLIILIDSLIKFNKIRHKDIPIKFPHMFLAVFRSYLAFFYHCCAFVSRYYLIWSIVIFPFVPFGSGIIIGMHFLAGLVEFSIKKPRLNLISFLFYFSLEQLSYQLGVWWRCIRMLYFGPVNPKIVYKTI
jgi:mycofactocin system glycosyltransferase